jgi:hypothetical protein
MLIGLSAFILFAAFLMLGMEVAIWLLAAAQLFLLANEIRKGQVMGGGAFLFMSFLFFGMRPIYLVLERDHYLFTRIFLIRPDLTQITDAMWWATLSMLCFSLALQLAPKIHRGYLKRRLAANKSKTEFLNTRQQAPALLVAAQIFTLPIMYYLAVNVGKALRGTGLGAYGYELPIPMQALHIFAVVFFFDRYLRKRSVSNVVLMCLSTLVFLVFTWLMRDVSNFRGFYLTGVMIVGIACLQRWLPRVSYAWLIIPIIVAQPLFQYLGQARKAANVDLTEQNIAAEVFEDRGVIHAYWSFYQAQSGDMNIFDTFVAAKQNEPRFRPYLWSWIYVPLHIIPRALWPGKPERGVTQDISYNRGAPLSPGIVGFFMRDGGLLWMLGSMFLLGYLIALLDWYIQTMPRGYLRCCLISITVINAMYLTRFYLWQYFYQVLYAAIPCIVLAWYLKKQGSGTPRRRVSRTAKRGALLGPAV